MINFKFNLIILDLSRIMQLCEFAFSFAKVLQMKTLLLGPTVRSKISSDHYQTLAYTPFHLSQKQKTNT